MLILIDACRSAFDRRMALVQSRLRLRRADVRPHVATAASSPDTFARRSDR